MKHPHLFPAAWKGKYVFLWRSVVLRRCGHLYVPFVYVDGGTVRVNWCWLGSDWNDDNPAVLSAS